METSFSCKNGRLTLLSRNVKKIFTAVTFKVFFYFICKPIYPDVKDKKAFTADTHKCGENWNELHRIFCYINTKYILNTIKDGAVHCILNFKEKTMSTCDECNTANSRRVSFKPIGKTCSSRHLELIHYDVCGPLPTKSNAVARYFVILIDDYSKTVVVYPLKQKNNVFESFKWFQKTSEEISKSQNIKSYIWQWPRVCKQGLN